MCFAGVGSCHRGNSCANAQQSECFGERTQKGWQQPFAPCAVRRFHARATKCATRVPDGTAHSGILLMRSVAARAIALTTVDELPVEPLTARELEVLQLLAAGQRNREI